MIKSILGANDTPAQPIPRVGLGCMGMSEFYGDADDGESLRLLRRAYELGYRHFDTADMYGLGANELLLAKFLRELGSQRHEVLIATKVGIRRNPAEPREVRIDSSADYVRAACEASLKRLGLEVIDLLYVHRRNRSTPIEETMTALAELRAQGKIRGAGLSEVSAATLRAAHRVHPVTALQSEYSLWTRDVEQELLATCEEIGAQLVAYSPLGRGFLAQQPPSTWAKSGDLRQKLPRFQAQNYAANRRLVDRLGSIAAELALTTAELALSWVLHQRPYIHIIPGSRHAEHLAMNFSVQRIRLPHDVLARLDELFRPQAVSGLRYPEPLLETTDA